MSSELERQLREYSGQYITDLELGALLKGTQYAISSQIKRAVKAGLLIHVRRGLYCLGGYLARNKPSAYVLATRIYGPSYISFESALSYYGLIPEAVYTVTSATILRTKTFSTPLCEFSYLHIPLSHAHFLCEVEIAGHGDNAFFIASPWKALCDYALCYKENNFSRMVGSLRLSLDELPQLDSSRVQELKKYYATPRINFIFQEMERF